VIQHVALETRERDADACVAFWALLGFDEVEVPATLQGTTRWVQRPGGDQIHLLFAGDPVAPPSGHVAVVCAGYDATLARLRAAGLEPDPRREHWGAPRSFVRDPAGHRVELRAASPA
jgi:catechol 2,3-dioxygenase-like lactoylglutathione lyase family enzyme